MSKQDIQDQTTAALEVVDMEKRQEAAVVNDQVQREQMIAECHEMIGRIQGFELIKKFTDVGSLVWLKDVKESKIYKDLPNIGTWDKFCNYIGLSRSKVDEDLTNLAFFGESFIAAVGSFSIGYRELRKLRQLSSDGSVQIEAQTLTIGGETIPLDDDHAEELQAAIENVLDAKTQEAEETQAALKAKDRILKSKEDVINRQEKELAKHESRAKKQGFAPGEEAFLKQLAADKLVVDDILEKYSVDDGALDAELTERMKAELVATLEYFQRVATAYHAAAETLYESDGKTWDSDALIAEFEEENPEQKVPHLRGV
ncbi:hypothetical protein HTZ97_15920 [Desulfuromonas acetoxidans]|uniref:Uncharacterized protein n=1 Tax=Desulfuromonas acetoxidans (strain DSM 684 / 11070) TaxID=281689 RepID=Q1JVI1_DESA6|nr:hypothetical protein [Desulfuromonas acetoxidans]EAT14262.1 hypothetical protein Dace_0104 [Desulfuromonas acetoxidans DSM 684]MBF0647170.1 hypothetical protein [Desulfuromonas acetoxidans]NVD26126.1 hypothetical protein [Desulfuromonas acetoxidans]NVE17944.1 hypothetical protein [Desulfuromonas acetoxidans]